MDKQDHARRLVIKHSGPRATVYACPFCHHTLAFPKTAGTVRAGSVGRGYGLRNGGRLHAQMGAHIRAEHASEVAKVEGRAT